MPKGRSILYAEFRAAERARVRFPYVYSDAWDDLDWLTQITLIAYDQIRTIEEIDAGT